MTFKVSLVGNVGREDSQLKQTSKGNVLSFSMGVRCGQDATEWVQVSIWGKYGEAMKDHIKAKTGITVFGKLDGVEMYQKRDGGSGKSIRVTANDVVVHRAPSDQRQQSLGQSRPQTQERQWESPQQQQRQPQQQQQQSWQAPQAQQQGGWGQPQQSWQPSGGNGGNQGGNGGDDPIPF